MRVYYTAIYIYTWSVDILNTYGSNTAATKLNLHRPLRMTLSQYDHMLLSNPI